MNGNLAVSLAGATTATLFATTAIDSGEYIHVTAVMLVMDQNGSFKFTDGVSDLTGPISVAARQPFYIANDQTQALFETLAPGRPLQLVVGGSAAATVGGFVRAFSDNNPG